MEGQVAGLGEGPDATGDGWDVLFSPARLAVLRQVGLTAAADPDMERFARLVARMLGVPVALVSLVESDRQVFPGQVGLDEPWATTRQTPLSHSMCQHVAATGSPLVLADARQDQRTCDNLAMDDLGVIAYAGMPLTDGQGHVLGSLCAIDNRPRTWTQRELADLADLAAACSSELRLRIASQVTQSYAAQAKVALERSELMLRAAEDLVNTTSVTDVRRRVRSLVGGGLKPSYVGLALLDGEQLHRIPDPEISYAAELIEPVFPLHSPRPSAHAARERRIIVLPDRASIEADYGPEAIARFDEAGLATVVCVPLNGARQVLGTLILGWENPYQIGVSERAVLTTIAGYTARAIDRAVYLDERISVSRQLQQAMLTDLPATPGLQVAARYRPAAAGNLVGGDWYDVYPLVSRPLSAQGAPDQPGAAVPVPMAITVGDITGHDVHAAAIMGQVRSMLRQADLDHLGRGPAQALTAVENACHALSFEATGSLVHAHLRPLGGTDGWQLTWTNAGHLPPLLAHPDGHAERLGGNELLLWPGMPEVCRTDRRRVLMPGDTLLLYTDGLVERRGYDVDLAIENAAAVLAAAPAGQPLPDVLDVLTSQVADEETDDDIALLAVRIPGRPS
jgi:serine phosphatase RsbU (regulator of sigma subunit)/transcriptional regulator with GAF, ATPase, and Fis domain